MRIDTVFEQGTGALNEDFLVVDKNLFGVFDGATSLSSARFGHGLTGGYLASTVAGTAFRGSDLPLRELADKANRAILDAMRKHGVDMEDRANLWSTSAAVVRVEEDRFEWVQIGDCLVMTLHDDGTHRVHCAEFNHDLETLTMWQEASCESQGTVLDVIHEQIVKVRRGMNVTYGVFNGEPAALDFLNAGSLPLEGITDILLFTDGLFIPKSDPGEREDFDRFAELFRAGGLKCVRDHVRCTEAGDAACTLYPRFKVHDDVAAISIAL
ncbi:protein phosphatase 2C domain-containing protein [uncultured Pseudodesulfovibrio sp.]|uniref:protein phosphatase 2C domain-containing protein n=1 Tax=uncultured Pseudodesulfovibrio sp. TaxID=2035858 RepID=UPI0029C66617|nr:protein phosphatase 2C domain-containing protein [uncultured Pseudodesulfovibrio sp.]